VEEFVEGQFFSGELYIDLQKKSYNFLNFKRLGLTALASVFNKKGRAAMARAKEMKLGGNMKGDGFQNGGAIIIKAGGTEVLLMYKQDHPADHVDNNDVLTALGIPTTPETEAAMPKVQCNEDVCVRQ